MFLGRFNQIVGNVESTHVDRAKRKATLLPKIQIDPNESQHWDLVAQLVKKRALVKS